MKRVCESCEEIIDDSQQFESDDEEIFEAVMVRTINEDVCYECALCDAMMENSMKNV